MMKPAMSLQQHAELYADAVVMTQGSLGISAEPGVAEIHMEAMGGNQTGSQLADTANGIATGAAFDPQEQQPEPHDQASELRYSMETIPRASS